MEGERWVGGAELEHIDEQKDATGSAYIHAVQTTS